MSSQLNDSTRYPADVAQGTSDPVSVPVTFTSGRPVGNESQTHGQSTSLVTPFVPTTLSFLKKGLFRSLPLSQGYFVISSTSVGQVSLNHLKSVHPHEDLVLQVEVNPNHAAGAQVFLINARRRSLRTRLVAVALIAWLLRPSQNRFWRLFKSLLTRRWLPAGGSFCGFQLTTDRVVSRTVLTENLGLLRGLDFPKFAHIALSNSCNLECVMCPYHGADNRAQMSDGYFESKKFFDRKVLLKVLDELGARSSGVTFGQFDEPFVFPRFTEIVEYAKEAGCSVSVTTNGTLLDLERSKRLIAAGVDHISFSLDAATSDTYSKIRLDDFSKPLNNIKTLVEERKRQRAKTHLRACLVIQDDNAHEVESFYSLCQELGLDSVSFYKLSTFEGGLWTFPTLYNQVEVPEERYVCSQLFDQVAIYPTGEVALCCLTTMYHGFRRDLPFVGNIATSSLADIWLSQPYRQVRHEAFQGVFSNSVCRDCTIWHNSSSSTRIDERGNREVSNPYERFVYLNESWIGKTARKLL